MSLLINVNSSVDITQQLYGGKSAEHIVPPFHYTEKGKYVLRKNNKTACALLIHVCRTAFREHHEGHNW